MRVHDSYDSDTWKKIRDPKHMQEVLVEIEKNFPKYFTSYWKPPKKRKHAIQEALDEFLKIQPKYQDFLDLETLEEYGEDPSGFKGDIKKDVPIIQGAYHSRDEAMKKYKISFNGAKGIDLLTTTTKIAEFGKNYMAEFDDDLHELCETPEDMRLAELQEEAYFSSGVIGEGIKAHFLYCLYPNAFPNRGQNAIWSLYFLTNKKEFGFWDGSEFLMIDVGQSTIQQNFLYPYDLFCFYALKIYLMLREWCAAEQDYHFDSSYRYVYLQNFFDHIVATHEGDISTFMINVKDNLYEFSYYH